MQVTRSAEYALDWPHYKDAPEVFLCQTNYNALKEVVFHAQGDRRSIMQLAEMGGKSIAIFKITRKVFVNHKGELV
jgi:hypothetical protein